MYVQKGFISNTVFANNTPGVIATLGELSGNSITFSREKGQYSLPTVKDLILTSFTSKDGVTAIQAPSAIVDQILHIADFTYAQTLSGQAQIDPTLLLENLIVTFGAHAQDFASGNIISDGTHSLPEWLAWKSNAAVGFEDNFIKIWFVDQSFQQQYDEYEIVVVPPLAVVDNFFQSGAIVETALYAVSSAEKTDLIQAAKNGYPETVIRTNTYLYVDPANALHTVPTDWSVLIYGAAGDNVDSIKDTLIEYILANTTHTRESWTALLPDIFKRTEFIMLPLWDQYAIPNRVLEKGIYSPQIVLSGIVAKMKQFATQYPTAHIDSHLTSMTHPYRSVAIVTVGSPDNRQSKYKLSDIFPDLIAVTSTSLDFNRMSKATQDWAVMLANMLVVAESMGDFTVIPVGMMKIRRNGILYLTKSYQNINYLVVAKVNAAFGGV